VACEAAEAGTRSGVDLGAQTIKKLENTFDAEIPRATGGTEGASDGKKKRNVNVLMVQVWDESEYLWQQLVQLPIESTVLQRGSAKRQVPFGLRLYPPAQLTHAPF
jgi:hypothetical protein